MIKISSPEQQLRQNRAMLLLIGGISSLGGLLVWSATPFAANNPKDPVHISLRYIALVSGLVAGASAVACGAQLERIRPLIEAVEAAEKKDFLSQLAVSCYTQEERYYAEALPALSPVPQAESPKAPVISSSGSQKVAKPVTNEEPMVTEVTPAVTTTKSNQGVTAESAIAESELDESESTESAELNAADIAYYKAQYLSVKEALANGESESKIIKEVLGLTGRYYAGGRSVIEYLLTLGEQQNWG